VVGHAKVAHVDGVVVACVQQCTGLHPAAAQMYDCGCCRLFKGAGQTYVAHVVGVVVGQGVVVGDRQQNFGKHPHELQISCCG